MQPPCVTDANNKDTVLCSETRTIFNNVRIDQNVLLVGERKVLLRILVDVEMSSFGIYIVNSLLETLYPVKKIKSRILEDFGRFLNRKVS